MVDKVTSVLEIQGKYTGAEAMARVKRDMQDATKAAQGANNMFRLLRGGAGQLGHQVQDIAVQLQMGTDKLIVFGQQGGQIASLFGPQGAILGAVLGVGAAIGTALTADVKTGTDALELFEDTLNDVSNATKNLADDTLALSQEIVDLASKSMVAAQAEISIAIAKNSEATEQLQGQFKRLGRESTAVGADLLGAMEDAKQPSVDVARQILRISTGFRDVRPEMVKSGKAGKEAWDIIGKSIDGTGATLVDVQSAITAHQVAMKEGAGASEFKAAGEAFAELAMKMGDPAFIQFSSDLLNQAVALENSETKTDFLINAQKNLAGALLDTDAALEDQVDLLEAGSKAELDAINTSIKAREKQEKEQAKWSKSLESMESSLEKQFKTEESNYQKRMSSADKFVASLIKGAQDERTQIETTYQERVDAVNALFGQELIDKYQHRDALKAVADMRLQDIIDFNLQQAELDEQESQRKQRQADKDKAIIDQRIQAEKNMRKMALGMATNAMKDMAALADEGTAEHKALFAAQQAFNIASIIASAHMSAEAAGAQASLWGGAPAWATTRNLILASGYASAGVVAGQTLASFEGGGITFNGIRAGGLDGKGGRMAVVHPNEKITDLEKEGAGAQPISVNVNIQAIDTQSGMEFIMKNRDILTNAVSRSMNNRGRRL